MITPYLPNRSRGSVFVTEIKPESERSGFRIVAGVIYFFLSLWSPASLPDFFPGRKAVAYYSSPLTCI